MSDDRSRDPFQPAATPNPSAGTARSEPFDRPLDAVPLQPAPVRPRSRGGMLVNVLLGLAVAVAIGGVAFAAGRVSAPATAAAAARQGFGAGGPTASGAPGGFGGGGFGAGGVALQGTVTSLTADSITLQLASGQSVTIPIDAQTTWHERTAATAADVTTGSSVIVQLQGGRGGGGQGGQGGGGPAASGAPGRALGSASTVTLVPAGS